MNIKELHVKNYGRLHDVNISLEEGINLITGANESGKTTLHAFIRGMLYGMPRQRGRAAARDQYSRYQPWENNGYYAGTLRFESGGKIFRINRDFSREHPKAELVCETDGERLSIEQGDLKMLLGNISEAVFDNTVSIGQLKAKTNESLLRALRSYMAVYGESQAGGTDVEEALCRLRLTKKGLEKQIREEYQSKQKKIMKLNDRKEYIRQEIQMEKDREIPEDSREKKKTGWRLLAVIITSVCAALLIGLSGILPFSVAAILLCTAAAAGGMFCEGIKRKKRRERRQWERERQIRSIEEKQLELDNLQNEIEEIDISSRHPLEEEIRAIDMAEESIRELAERKSGFLGETLQKKMAGIFSSITDGKYTGIHLSEDLTIGIDAGEAYVEPEQLSRGTVEQLYFAFRMAAGEILCREEALPFLLDDVFAMYDEKRLGQTLRWLSGCGHQILIFTCHKREERLLGEMKLPFHKINLEEKEC
ncbi:MAG: ATP-binding protein [Ruminococcus sp.]|jgi:energy-coupling factor transporter ATP-binding protein EcfA2